MNRDDSGITGATDAAAPAAAPIAEAATPSAPFAEMDEPGKVSDAVVLREHYETDDELAALALEHLNDAIPFTPDPRFSNCRTSVGVDGVVLATGACNILVSRALMRSAAAHDRLAAVGERNERRQAERRTLHDELEDLQLKIWRLQLASIEGDIARLREIAAIAFDFAADLRDAPLHEGEGNLSVVHVVPNDARRFVQKLALLQAQLGPGTVVS